MLVYIVVNVYAFLVFNLHIPIWHYLISVLVLISVGFFNLTIFLFLFSLTFNYKKKIIVLVSSTAGWLSSEFIHYLFFIVFFFFV